MNLNKDDIQKLDFNKACHDAVAHEYSKTHLDNKTRDIRRRVISMSGMMIILNGN